MFDGMKKRSLYGFACPSSPTAALDKTLPARGAMKDCDYISTSQLTHLIECQQQQPSLGESRQQYSSQPDDTSESQQQQQQPSTASMAVAATVANCLEASAAAAATNSATSLDYQQQHLHQQHQHHQLQLQQYHHQQQQAYQQQQQQHHHHHQHHTQQHVNNGYHYAGYLNSEHYGDHAAGVAGSDGSPAEIHGQQQQQEQKPSFEGAEWLAAGVGHREPLAYSPWLASQQHQDSGLQQQVATSQEQYGQQEQLHGAGYAADSQLATPSTAAGHISPATPVAYNPSAVAALYSSTILQHQQSGYQHPGQHPAHHHGHHHGHHQHQLEHQHQPLGHQHEFGQVQAQHQQQLQNHTQHHHLHQHQHKTAWLHSTGVPLVSVSSPLAELRDAQEASLDNQQQQSLEDGQQQQRHLASFLPGTGQVGLHHHHHHHHHSPNSSTSTSSSASSSSSSSASSLMNLSPTSGDNSQLPATAATTTTAPAAGRVLATATKKAPPKGLKRPPPSANGKKKPTGIVKAANGRPSQNLARNAQTAQVALKICQPSPNEQLQASSYSASHHLLGAIHVAGPYKDADIEHDETHIVVTNVETGRKVTLSNEQLTSLSVRQLNKMVAGFPRQTITKLKQRRRTLKNRGYAQNCRHKRVSQTKKLERQNQELREENRKLREKDQESKLLIGQLRRQLQAITMTSGNHHQPQETMEAATNPKAYPAECKAPPPYGEPANSNSTKMLPFIGKVRDLELQVSQLQEQLR